MGCDISCGSNPEIVHGHDEVYSKETSKVITENIKTGLVDVIATGRIEMPDKSDDKGRRHSIVDMDQPCTSNKRQLHESSSSEEGPQFSKESEKYEKVGRNEIKISQWGNQRRSRRRPNQSPMIKGQLPECEKRQSIRGVVGSSNSCYMDSSLNSLFLFNDAFLEVLEPTTGHEGGSGLRKRRKKNNHSPPSQASEHKQFLRDEIAIPLNTNKRLETGTMFKFRQILSQFTNKKSYIGSEMDAEEFISTLFGDVLKTPGFYIIDGHHEGSHVFQTYADMTKSRKEIEVQTLLDYSFSTSEITLDSIPKPGFILKMPVTDGRHLFGKIYPNLTINLENFMKKNKESSDTIPKMFLAAVICLAGHHFTAFVREVMNENSPWWFLNSFSGTTYIPELEESLEKFKYSQSNSRLAFLLSNCYMCFYLPNPMNSDSPVHKSTENN